MIKLLSRLFKTDWRSDLIAGVISIRLILVYRESSSSVVFQDFKIFEFSIEENVAAEAEKRLESALKWCIF